MEVPLLSDSLLTQPVILSYMRRQFKLLSATGKVVELCLALIYFYLTETSIVVSLCDVKRPIGRNRATLVLRVYSLCDCVCDTRHKRTEVAVITHLVGEVFYFFMSGFKRAAPLQFWLTHHK